MQTHIQERRAPTHWPCETARPHKTTCPASLNAVKDRGAKATTNRTLAALRRALSWALSEDLISVNPASRIVTNIEEQPKDRALSQDEIRKFWNSLDSSPIGERTRLAMRLVLVTGQRPGEVCGARKIEIDPVAGVWTIPQERVKNRQIHVVPLFQSCKGSFPAGDGAATG